MTRAVSWEGFFNARDLGGLAVAGGGCTRSGQVFRSATLHFVTEAGWSAAWRAGVRTIVDLRNDDEVMPASTEPLPGSALFKNMGTETPPPEGMTRVRVALDDVEDVELWREIRDGDLDGTPLYYRLFLARKAERCAEAVKAVVSAPPGGVLFHCGAGRDRTGLVALLLLALVDVTPEAVAEDYVESARALPALFAAMGSPDQGPLVEKVLRARGVTARQAVLDVLTGLDVATALAAGGLTAQDVRALRARLVEPVNQR